MIALQPAASRSTVVFGGSGFVGSRLLELWAGGSETLLAPTHAELDLLDTPSLAAFLARARARTVLNLAAGANVDGSEAESGNQAGAVYRLNAVLPARLAELCAALGSHLVHISTDYVFDGTNAERPYVESDPTNPLGWYAQTKALGEQAVLDADTGACVARIEMPFSGRHHPKLDFPRICAARLTAGEAIIGVLDQNITPVFLDDAISALRVLSEARYAGLIHVAAADWTTPFRLARSIANRLRLNQDLVQSEPFEKFVNQRPARRPQHSWLDVSRFVDLFGSHILRSVEAELDVWLSQLLGPPGRA